MPVLKAASAYPGDSDPARDRDSSMSPLGAKLLEEVHLEVLNAHFVIHNSRQNSSQEKLKETDGLGKH